MTLTIKSFFYAWTVALEIIVTSLLFLGNIGNYLASPKLERLGFGCGQYLKIPPCPVISGQVCLKPYEPSPNNLAIPTHPLHTLRPPSSISLYRLEFAGI